MIIQNVHSASHICISFTHTHILQTNNNMPASRSVNTFIHWLQSTKCSRRQYSSLARYNDAIVGRIVHGMGIRWVVSGIIFVLCVAQFFVLSCRIVFVVASKNSCNASRACNMVALMCRIAITIPITTSTAQEPWLSRDYCCIYKTQCKYKRIEGQAIIEGENRKH